jgi:hypothetical protein
VSDTANLPNDAPTAEAPEAGVIAIAVGSQRIAISQVEHWVEDGLDVFRSSEFDCIAMDVGVDRAVKAFIDSAEDVYRFLDDLVDAERATPDEVKTLAMLSRRFYDVYSAFSAQAQASRRRKLGALMRSRDLHGLTWQRQTTHRSSSPPVHA